MSAPLEGSVLHWISVGGLLGGTVLADQAEQWPMSWLAKLAFLFSGIDPRAIPGMTTVSRRRRMTELRFPKSLLVLDYVGARFRSSIQHRRKLGATGAVKTPGTVPLQDLKANFGNSEGFSSGFKRIAAVEAEVNSTLRQAISRGCST